MIPQWQWPLDRLVTQLGHDIGTAREAGERFGRLTPKQRVAAATLTVWCPASRHPVAHVYRVTGRDLLWLAGRPQQAPMTAADGDLIWPRPGMPANGPEWLDTAAVGSGWAATCRCDRRSLQIDREQLTRALAAGQHAVRVSQDGELIAVH